MRRGLRHPHLCTVQNNFTFSKQYKMKNAKRIIFATLFAGVAFLQMASAQTQDWKKDHKASILFGLAQIETLYPGIGFTPLILNVSVGYTFGLKKY